MTNGLAPSAKAHDVYVTTPVPGVTITLTRLQAKALYGLMDTVPVADAVRQRLGDGDFPREFREALKEAGVSHEPTYSTLISR